MRKTGGVLGGGLQMPGRDGAATSYKPALGRDFSVQEIRARTDQINARTRDFVARVLVGCVVTALGYAALMGMTTRNWSYLQVVWVPAGPIVGAMTAHYFRKG